MLGLDHSRYGKGAKSLRPQGLLGKKEKDPRKNEQRFFVCENVRHTHFKYTAKI
jgi:hypothetical protein